MDAYIRFPDRLTVKYTEFDPHSTVPLEVLWGRIEAWGIKRDGDIYEPAAGSFEVRDGKAIFVFDVRLKR